MKSIRYEFENPNKNLFATMTSEQKSIATPLITAFKENAGDLNFKNSSIINVFKSKLFTLRGLY